MNAMTPEREINMADLNHEHLELQRSSRAEHQDLVIRDVINSPHIID
jgi:hypothetical protein